MTAEPTRRAAQYLRVSKDQQRYSLAGQEAAVRSFASERGFTIVQTYVDQGVSGLTTAGRKGMQQLLADIVGGAADYEAVLVYDISRWGRFQDPDESAHYEFVCRQEGVAVEYCAEAFGDGVTGALLKYLKRVMAANYSRDLSANVARAQRRYAAGGLWQGGPPGYGLRRALLGEDGEITAIMERGEQKTITSDKVVVVLGPPEEQAVIARIYRLFLQDGVSRTEIVRILNKDGVPYGDGRPWTYQRVINVLTNPIYAGKQAFGRTVRRLGGASLERRPPTDWVLASTDTKVVSAKAQDQAARIIASRMVMLNDEEMLTQLTELGRREGRLSKDLINAAEGLPCSATYANRFGSLIKAYELIGYDHLAARSRLRWSPKSADQSTASLQLQQPTEQAREPSASKIRAVTYLRMSTRDQPNSLALQEGAIEAYATSHRYETVRTYRDAAKSGVTARRRPAFRELLATILSGKADFEVVLVNDVSRWGRFQDPDEAASYEFLCRQEGVRIEYCAESFEAEGGGPTALMKALKRGLAAEFSRDLGVKVRAAQRRYAQEGYWLHGEPGYGLARQVVKPDGAPGRLLARGERNGDPELRTVVVRGPPHEIKTVRRMFSMCVDERLSTGMIATRLNQEEVPSPGGKAWSGERVRDILTNPKYVGDLLTQRRTTPLGGARRAAPTDDWITAKGAGPALVTRSVFNRAQAALQVTHPPDDDALLEALRPIAELHGVVSEPRLKDLCVPYYRSYRHRFGSLLAAFALIGHAPPKHFPKRNLDEAALLAGLAGLFLRSGDITPGLIDADPSIPSADHYRRRFDGLANAYARIGYVRISPAQARSAVGQARLRARQLQIEGWAKGDGPAAPF